VLPRFVGSIIDHRSSWWEGSARIKNNEESKFRGGAAPGIGLAGMRERLAEFGGQINVESSSGGSMVEAVIPTRPFVKKKTASAAAVQA
jgi:signal transduction histidine kinase